MYQLFKIYLKTCLSQEKVERQKVHADAKGSNRVGILTLRLREGGPLFSEGSTYYGSL